MPHRWAIRQVQEHGTSWDMWGVVVVAQGSESSVGGVSTLDAKLCAQLWGLPLPAGSARVSSRETAFCALHKLHAMLGSLTYMPASVLRTCGTNTAWRRELLWGIGWLRNQALPVTQSALMTSVARLDCSAAYYALRLLAFRQPCFSQQRSQDTSTQGAPTNAFSLLPVGIGAWTFMMTLIAVVHAP